MSDTFRNWSSFPVATVDLRSGIAFRPREWEAAGEGVAAVKSLGFTSLVAAPISRESKGLEWAAAISPAAPEEFENGDGPWPAVVLPLSPFACW
jgi:hypothetical protein